ncbi:MAG: hypothetical protein JJU12_07235 [Chlamydiales bacterium]|nr:hypothetical protein [Chlamydiales bacterium]
MELVFSGFEQHFLHKGEAFFARIYGGRGELPEGFNVQTIRLDASERSALKWKFEVENALILWELDFALDALIPEDEARYLALELAVEHFAKTVWPQFEEQTFGVALYRGPFAESWLDTLKLLASRLPETVRPFVFFDTTYIEDAETYFRSLNQAALGFLTPILKGKWPETYPYAFPALAWDHPHSPLGFFSEIPFSPLPERPLQTGVVVPESGPFPVPDEPVRMIPEQILTHEWEGIDRLIAVSSAVTDRCRRKLLGFEAAGGEVLFLDS